MNRFIERVYGINMDEVRAKILSKDEYDRAVRVSKSCKIKKDTHIVVIEDGTVVTILDKKMKTAKNFIGPLKCHSSRQVAAYKDSIRQERSSSEHL